MSPNNRIYGLDTLRACAILLVFIHNFSFADNQITFGFITKLGWVGVDLFFVISGYLIGDQIFSIIARKQKFSVKVFFIRRIFRTVPNYLILVALYYFFDKFRDGPNISPLYKLLTFTTNFGLKTGTGFSYSWSLCVEEQFYFILPLIVVFVKYQKSIKAAWGLIIFTLIGGMILRGNMWLSYVGNILDPNYLNPLQFAAYQSKIYFPTFCRLDEICFGLGIALLKNFHKNIWYKITSKGNLILFIGILCCCITFWVLLNYHYTLFVTFFGFSLLGFSFGLLVISTLSSNSLLNKMRIPGAETIAILSFAIYLVEKPLNKMTISFLNQYHIALLSDKITFIYASIISLLGAWLLYFFIETPFITLRDKIYIKPRYTL